MDMVAKVKAYTEWYDTIDAMRGLESIPVSELLQMAFSAGVEAAEHQMQRTASLGSPIKLDNIQLDPANGASA